MKKSLALNLTPEEAFDPELFVETVKKKSGWSSLNNDNIRIKRRSIDARSKKITVNVAIDLSSDPKAFSNQLPFNLTLKNVHNADPVVIVGMGPAGIFAALRLIERGLKPILLERGKDVQSRRRDLAAINKKHIVNPDSNYCFGEGGAGTYSDGKLYTRAKKRGDIQRILEILAAHGAPENILYEAHPHIGTNKLPKVVAALRQTIENAGGKILFNTKVSDFKISGDQIVGVVTSGGEMIKGKSVILATGHSARDVFELLVAKKIAIEEKPFAIGVRVEHPQSLIDAIQYHCKYRGPYLPAAAYSLTHQVRGKNAEKRGVYSFCMCPGGFIVPAATSPGELVVNGMSPSRRDSKFANSGIVVAVNENDYRKGKNNDPLSGLRFQQSVERAAFQAGGQSQSAPAQRLLDFIERKISNDLMPTSYQPGLVAANMHDVLPEFIGAALSSAFKAFGSKMKGYVSNEAQIIGVESRTSSPVKIPRDKVTCEHPQLKRLFPCGEGAGYAGGIVSAAMDGERCANAVADNYF